MTPTHSSVIRRTIWWLSVFVAAVISLCISLFARGLVADYNDAISAAPSTRVSTGPLPGDASSSTDTSEPSSPDSTDSSESATPGDGPGAVRARQLLGLVVVVPSRPNLPGYERDCGPGDGCVFGTEWSDDTDASLGQNGCDTRNDVLAASLTNVRFSTASPKCDVTGGILVDPYTAVVMDYATEGSQIHIDHLFPLAAAWDLGAAAWTPRERATFANDPDLELVAVNGGANLSKGDSTPASWLPPNRAYRCSYVTGYLEVAYAYGLAITAADVRVIEPVLRKHCRL